MTDQVGNKNGAARSRFKAKPAKEKRPHYISFNDQEMATLRQLGFRERWTYMELKGLSNWKDGSCGDFDRQCLSYAQLARLVTAPGIQGRGNGSIDDTQAADYLEKMVAVGLVANIGRRSNGGLRFDLPLSPIKKPIASQSGQNMWLNSGERPEISPAQIASQNTAQPTPASVSNESAPSLSVMINNKKNISIDAAGPANAGPAPCHASGVAPSREILIAQPMAAAPLTAREIQFAVADNWTFTDTDTPEAQKLYESWADAGITLAQLQSAMTSVEESSSNDIQNLPKDLHSKLWPNVVENFVERLASKSN